MFELIMIGGYWVIVLYLLWSLQKVYRTISEVDAKLNERHAFFQTTWAKEYVRLENKVKDIEKDIYPKT